MKGWMHVQIKEGKLTWATAELVHESTGQVATKDSTEIVVRYLDCVSKDYRNMIWLVQSWKSYQVTHTFNDCSKSNLLQ